MQSSANNAEKPQTAEFFANDNQKLGSGRSVSYIDLSVIQLPESQQQRLAHLNSIYG